MEQPARLSRIGLYYPYIHFRDERWLKTAALYWPRIARIVDDDYPIHDSELVKRLIGELDFIVNVQPSSARDSLAEPFAKLISPSWPDRWRIAADASWEPDQSMPMEGTRPRSIHSTIYPIDVVYWATPAEYRSPLPGRHIRRASPPVSGIHISEISPRLYDRLIHEGFARRVGEDWIGVHPELAWLYKCHLTADIASSNKLAPTTDQLEAHAFMSGPSLPAGFANTSEAQPKAIAAQSVETTFGLLAVTAVIPTDIENIPIAKIIEMRRRFNAEFDRWRQYSDHLSAELADQLGDIESPAVLSAYLQDAVKRYSLQPVVDLRRSLDSLGLDSMLQTVNTKFEVPASLTALGLLAQPQLAAAAGIAAGAVAIRQAGRKKAVAAQMTPAAYLLNIQETLNAKSWLQRIILTMRHIAGLR